MDVQLIKDVPSEAQIRRYIKQLLFGDHIFCPVCHSRRISKSGKRYWCTTCRIWFSLLSHTWLSHTKLPLQDLWVMLWCFTKQIPIKQTEAITGLSEKAVRRHFSLFRSQLPKDSMLLSHLVQVDEAYFGGMLGFALLMGKQKGTRKLAYQILPHNAPSKHEAITFIQTFVQKSSSLATDGSILYKHIENYYPVMHTVDIHKKFEFTHTSEIEGMFGVLRTFIRRMYHHVTVKHFPEIMCEFYYRFCHPEMFQSPYEYLLNTLRLATTG